MTQPIEPPDLNVLDIPTLSSSFPSLLAAAVTAMPCTTAPDLFATTAAGHTHGQATVHAAQRLCLRCPLREPCAAYGCHHRERGVWGGTTEHDRRNALSNMP